MFALHVVVHLWLVAVFSLINMAMIYYILIITSKDHPETVWVSGFYYNSLNNDTVYGYNSERFFPCFLIDFGLEGIPAEIKSKPLHERSSAVYKYLKEQNYKVASWFSVLSRKKNRMHLSYAYNRMPYFGLYDFEKKTVIKEFYNPLLGNMPVSDIISSVTLAYN